jgi:hypothetical protein
MAQEGVEGDQPLCGALATSMGWNLVAHGRLSACLYREYLHPGTYLSAAQRDAVGVAQNLGP